MKISLQKLTLVLFAIFINNASFAQEKVIDKVISLVEDIIEAETEEEEETSKGLSISGSADTYFRANLSGGSNDGSDGGTLAPASSFANLPGFSLGMANLIGTYEQDKGGVVVDLVFGPRGSDAVFASSPTNGLYSSTGDVINQLYAYWNVSDHATITMGNFNTFLGYEVISPTANFNYSTTYAFSYGPFSHTGLKLDIATESGFSIMAAVLNPTDITEFNPTGDYYYGAQLGYGGFYLNGLFGEDYSQFDLTGGVDVSEKLYLGINATITDAGENVLGGDQGFFGAALYAQLATSDNFKIGARYEFFQDKDGDYVFGSNVRDTNASDFTLSGNYSVGNLTIIPEIRFDSISEDIFIDSDGKAGGSLTSFVLAFAYGF